MNPHCSTDGAWVVYNSIIGDDVHVMKVSAEGGPPVSLAKGGNIAGARYSPDGKQIAFYSADPDKIVELLQQAGSRT